MNKKLKQMKKVVFLASIAIVVLVFAVSCGLKGGKTTEVIITDTEHNSQNSLDWEGVYQGIIPCADCEGIEVKITLNQDGTYEKSDIYLGKKGNLYKSAGKFSWDANGQIITLDGQSAPNQYFVGENTLTHLDMEGNQIDGEHAEDYVLHKNLSQE